MKTIRKNKMSTPTNLYKIDENSRTRRRAYTVRNVYGISGESSHRTPEAACRAACMGLEGAQSAIRPPPRRRKRRRKG